MISIFANVLFPRAHVEREDQGDQQEKLDQRWETYLQSLFFNIGSMVQV